MMITAYIDAVSSTLATGRPAGIDDALGAANITATTDERGRIVAVDVSAIVHPAIALMHVLVEYAADATGASPEEVLFDLRQQVSERFRSGHE
jgi:hypothetical protein